MNGRLDAWRTNGIIRGIIRLPKTDKLMILKIPDERWELKNIIIFVQKKLWKKSFFFKVTKLWSNPLKRIIIYIYEYDIFIYGIDFFLSWVSTSEELLADLSNTFLYYTSLDRAKEPIIYVHGGFGKLFSSVASQFLNA